MTHPTRGWGRTIVGLFVAALVVAAAFVSACGESADDPDDCRPGEFFNQATERCTPCPALGEPDCVEGCGYTVVEDSRGCPEFECAETCLCDDEEYFSDDSLECEECQEASDPPRICSDEDGEDDSDD